MLLDIEGTGFKLFVTYKYRQLILPMGGKWDAHRGCFVIPGRINHDVLSKLPGLEITEDAQRRIAILDSIPNLCNQEDAEIKYGEGIDPYQRVGVKFLASAKRAILADEVGIGKSAQAIRASHEVGASSVLVVTKKSIINGWRNTQIPSWGIDNSITWTVTNYEQIVLHPEEYKPNNYDVIIIDEAHYIRNRPKRNREKKTMKGKRTQAIWDLTRNAEYVWLLTGTPMLNNPQELWSLLHCVDPKRYSSYWRFVEEYCEMGINTWTGNKKPGKLRQDRKQQMAEELAPVLLSRSKKILGLRPESYEDIAVDMTPEQRKLYNEIETKCLAVIGDNVVFTPVVVAQLTRLRQILCSPALLGGKDSSGKTEVLLDLIESYADDHKILVFSSFAKYVDNLHTKLKSYKAVKIHGGVTGKKRTEAEDTFIHDPKCRVLLGTIGAMSDGMNLQVADVVIFVDKEWVPKNIEQAIGRSQRRGQTNPVHVISLFHPYTVDEHVQSILREKEEMLTEAEFVLQVLTRRREVT